MENKLTGFREKHNTQYYLLSMTENWKNTGAFVVAIFMNLPKTFVTLNQYLQIAKLGA